MSLISLSYPESSESIAKDYASIVLEQVDVRQENRLEPSTRSSSLTVSLENLYRLLEMFKYQSYADEPRRGVLMLQQVNDFSAVGAIASHDHWHDRITAALESSLEAVYPDLDRTEAIQTVQFFLRVVARGEDLQCAQRAELRNFFISFRDKI